MPDTNSLAGPVLVIAGNYSQYRSFLREYGLSPAKFRFADDARHIMGMRDAQYIKVGEWWTNPIMVHRRELIRAYNLKEIKV